MFDKPSKYPLGVIPYFPKKIEQALNGMVGSGIKLDDLNKDNEDISLPPPTTAPVYKEDLYKALDYDPNKGGGDLRSAFKYGFEASKIANTAKQEARKVFPSLKGADDDGDAFRHALGSYMMTTHYGAKAAKEILDGHERSPGLISYGSKRTEESNLQDLYNNKVGRDAALNPKNKDRNPLEVTKELYYNGKLQTRPFLLKRR